MFSFKRSFEQFKIIWMQNAQRQGLTLAIITLILVYIHINMYYHGSTTFDIGGGLGTTFDFGFWSLIVGIMTILNSTNVFSALLHTNSGIHYYMTPASIGEKFAAAWFYSSIFTIAIYSLTIGLVHIASIAVGNAVTGEIFSYDFPNPTILKEGFRNLMSGQSLFFLGAVVFRKNPLGKTLLSFIFIGFIVGLISTVLFRWYMMGTDALNTTDMNSYNWSFKINSLPANLDNMKNIVKITAACIPFICWITAYFRLKTREI